MTYIKKFYFCNETYVWYEIDFVLLNWFVCKYRSKNKFYQKEFANKFTMNNRDTE